MANYIDPIDPSVVNPDNIDNYEKNTIDVLKEIQNTDMVNVQQDITNLSNYKSQCLQERHLKGPIANRPTAPAAKTVFFITQEV